MLDGANRWSGAVVRSGVVTSGAVVVSGASEAGGGSEPLTSEAGKVASLFASPGFAADPVPAVRAACASLFFLAAWAVFTAG